MRSAECDIDQFGAKRIVYPEWKSQKHHDVNKLKEKDVCENLTERLDCLEFDGYIGNFGVYFSVVDVYGFKVRKT